MDCLFNQVEWETGEMPLLPKSGWKVQEIPSMGYLAASEICVGMSIHHRRTHASAGIFEVVAIAVRSQDGALMFKCRGYSDMGEEIHPSLTYKRNELVEVTR